MLVYMLRCVCGCCRSRRLLSISKFFEKINEFSIRALNLAQEIFNSCLYIVLSAPLLALVCAKYALCTALLAVFADDLMYVDEASGSFASASLTRC